MPNRTVFLHLTLFAQFVSVENVSVSNQTSEHFRWRFMPTQFNAWLGCDARVRNTILVCLDRPMLLWSHIHDHSESHDGIS